MPSAIQIVEKDSQLLGIVHFSFVKALGWLRVKSNGTTVRWAPNNIFWDIGIARKRCSGRLWTRLGW